jgi:hypothetical protein
MRHPTAELITVTYSGDLATLYYHALSLAKFWTGEKRWTVIVEDQAIYQRVIQWINDRIVPEMSDWTVNVTTGPVLVSYDGWHRQQVLKLWAASVSTAEYSVILDSKNFLIRDLNISDFFDGDKLKVGIFTEKTRPSNITDPTHIEACRILGVTDAIEIHPITPFVWRNSLVRDLLAKLNSLNYDILTQPEIKASEAALYWVYAQDKESWVDANEIWAFGQYGGVTKSTRLSPEQLREQFNQADKNNAFMITMHRFHITPENADILSEYLRTKGLVSDQQIAFFRDTFKECLYRIRPEVIDILYKEWGMPPLVTIKRNGKTIKFNRIVAYGCSHTAGSELADHVDWHEPITILELDKIKRKWSADGNRGGFYLKYPHLVNGATLEKCKALGWPAQVAKRFGVPIVNKAIPGNSMQGMVYNIEQDLFEGNISENDLVLIGATSMDRFLHFSNRVKDGWPIPATPIIGCPWLWPTEKFHNDFVEHIADDYFILFNYYNTLRHLELLSEQQGGRFLVQFIHQTMRDYISFLSNKPLEERFMAMVSSTDNFKSIIDHDLALGNLVNWNNESQVHGFYHPHIEFHEQLADLIVDKLSNNE